MDYVVNIALGVVSGVLTSTFLFVSGWWITRRFVPWYRDVRYQGVVVSGLWRAELPNRPNEPPSHMSLTLTQHAYALSGTLHIINREPKNPYELTFEVTGKLWDSYLSLSMTPVDRRVTSIATALFMVRGGGSGLQGNFAIRDTSKGGVQGFPLNFARVDLVGHPHS